MNNGKLIRQYYNFEKKEICCVYRQKKAYKFIVSTISDLKPIRGAKVDIYFPLEKDNEGMIDFGLELAKFEDWSRLNVYDPTEEFYERDKDGKIIRQGELIDIDLVNHWWDSLSCEEKRVLYLANKDKALA